MLGHNKRSKVPYKWAERITKQIKVKIHRFVKQVPYLAIIHEKASLIRSKRTNNKKSIISQTILTPNQIMANKGINFIRIAKR